MTDADILDLIDAYGADTAAYPEKRRQTAQKRIAEAPEVFASALAAARRIDTDLAALPIITPDKSFIDAIVETAPFTVPAETQRPWWKVIFGQGARLPAAGALASLGLGLVLGLNAPTGGSSIDETTTDETVFAATFGGADYTYWEEFQE